MQTFYGGNIDLNPEGGAVRITGAASAGSLTFTGATQSALSNYYQTTIDSQYTYTISGVTGYLGNTGTISLTVIGDKMICNLPGAGGNIGITAPDNSVIYTSVNLPAPFNVSNTFSAGIMAVASGPQLPCTINVYGGQVQFTNALNMTGNCNIPGQSFVFYSN